VSEIYGLYVLRGIFSKIALAYLIFLLFTMVSLAYFLTIIRRDED
jgi:ABC-type multidrug transport system permease subunit